VVPDKALLRLAAQRPDLVLELGLRMSQEMKQQLGQLEALQAVGDIKCFCSRMSGKICFPTDRQEMEGMCML
jgi:hypothetical protein